MSYPRPVRSIHQIEVSSHCNLRCRYCPSRKLEDHRGQPNQFMTRDTYLRALEWARELNDPDDPMRAELSLTGIGEALMHPDFPWMLEQARRALPTQPLVFSTNGILLTDEYAASIAPYQPQVYVSLHRPEKAKGAIDAARKYGILAGYNPAAATDAFDWAGLLPEWEVTAPPITCEFLRSGWAVVLVDGRITACCLDAEGAGVTGHIDDPIGSVSIGPWQGKGQGCSTCHMNVPDPSELVGADA
jgi:hypothetical protein